MLRNFLLPFMYIRRTTVKKLIVVFIRIISGKTNTVQNTTSVCTKFTTHDRHYTSR